MHDPQKQVAGDTLANMGQRILPKPFNENLLCANEAMLAPRANSSACISCPSFFPMAAAGISRHRQAFPWAPV